MIYFSVVLLQLGGIEGNSLSIAQYSRTQCTCSALFPVHDSLIKKVCAWKLCYLDNNSNNVPVSPKNENFVNTSKN